ncbi:MAG: HDOD domain-containing protein [Acidimicrobiales bacterium]
MTAPAHNSTLASSVEALLDAMDRLPSQGNVALRVLWMADDPMTGLTELARVVETDPVLVARLLHLANSAYYSPRTPIGTVERAITLLGFATVRTVATVVACGLGSAAAVPNGFWQHASAVANAAQLIAWRFGIATGDAFTVGLLHDLGRGLLHVADPVQSAEIDLALGANAGGSAPVGGGLLGPAPAAAATGAPATEDRDGPETAGDIGPNDAGAGRTANGGADRLQLELAAFGITHADAAARVLTSWRFPPAMVDAIAHHHCSIDTAPTDLVRLLVSAEAVAERAFGAWGEPVDRDGGISVLAIEADRLETIVQRVRTESGTLAAVLGR